VATPRFEIDHFFVCTSAGAPEADRVIDAGFSEGSSNRHPGQGTANRRIFFQTTMLEFLWVEDEAAARSTAVRRLGLWERWHRRNSGACPFGVCLRPGDDSGHDPPFRTWTYQPPYSPLAIEVGINSEAADEPLLFYIPIARHQRAASVRQSETTDHRIGVRDVTALRISHPLSVRHSPVMRAVEETGLVAFDAAGDYLMHVLFDQAERGAKIDFRPEVPLTVSW